MGWLEESDDCLIFLSVVLSSCVCADGTSVDELSHLSILRFNGAARSPSSSEWLSLTACSWSLESLDSKGCLWQLNLDFRDVYIR